MYVIGLGLENAQGTIGTRNTKVTQGWAEYGDKAGGFQGEYRKFLGFNLDWQLLGSEGCWNDGGAPQWGEAQDQGESQSSAFGAELTKKN